MDPSIIELAKTFFAGISAAAAAIGVWRQSRDKRKAAEVFDKTFDQTRESPESVGAAEELVSIIPEEVVQDLEARADNCWTSYRRVLGGQYLPDEVDSATDAVRACVCRELRRMQTLNGSIPPRWQPQWERYNCDQRDEASQVRRTQRQAQTVSVQQRHMRA